MSGNTGTTETDSQLLTDAEDGQAIGSYTLAKLRNVIVSETSHITAAIQAAIPNATTSQLLGGTGAAGAAEAITLGTNLSLSGTTLNATGGSSVSPATAAPIIDGTAAVGTSALYARQDHVHPTDTSRASAASMLPLVTSIGPGGCAAISFAPTGHTFGLQVSSAPATLAHYYGTLGAAQAVFPFATALTNYTDRCVVQLALNTCTTNGGGIVQLPQGSIYLDTTVTWNANVTGLNGVASESNGATPRTALLCQTCGTSPALSYTGTGPVPLSNVCLLALNAGITSFPQSGGGTANTGYSSGSIALQIANANCGYGAENVYFFNFDNVYSFITGNVYCLTFIGCWHYYNNLGINIGNATTSGVISNSFEAMRWIYGGICNNNYGFYFNLPLIGGSLFLCDMSIDYNIVLHGHYDGMGGTYNQCQIPLVIDRCHIETNSATSGTGTRIYSNGNLFMTNNMITEQGSYPVGLVAPGYYGRESFHNNLIPGQGYGGTYVPLVYATGNVQFLPTGHGNSHLYGGDIILASFGNGCLVQAGGQTTTGKATAEKTGAYTIGLTDQRYMQSLVSTGGAVTIPPDSTFSHLIGTIISFLTYDTSTWTLTAGSGVTLTGNTALGGSAGKRSYCVKTANNTWLGYT